MGKRTGTDSKGQARKLPDGWISTSLGEVVKPANAKVDPREVPDSPYLSLKHIESNTTRIVGQGVGRDVKSTKSIFKAGDVLYGKLRPYLNKVCMPSFDGICSTDILVFSRSDYLDNRFLMRFLTRPEVVVYANHNMSGVQLPRISFEKLAAMEFLLPPRVEQDRIANKVEELLSIVGKAKDHLEKIPAILENFRKAVLNAACFGRLTEDWRERYPDLEPASKLLARTIERRTKEYEAACANAKAEGKKKPKKLTNLEHREVETSTLPTIPNSWTWVYLSELGELNRGRSRHRPRDAEHLYGGPYPFIQTGDIARSAGRITHHKQTYSEAGLAQSRLWAAGTVCITIAANIANSAILTYPACFPDSVVGLITEQGLCDNRYIEFFIRTAREDLSHFAPATAQKNINIGILSNVAVPLPPYEEQIEIADRVERLLSLADKTVRRVVIAEENTKKLTQSILAKAFTGELVPTEAELARRQGRTYETAEQLLARIKLEREKKRTLEIKVSEKIKVRGKVMGAVRVPKKRPVLEVLTETKGKLKPEELFRKAGFTEEYVDNFYEELREAVQAGQIREMRPNKTEVYLEAIKP